VYRQISQFPVPAIVLGRILAILFLLTIAAMYFVGESLGLIPPIVAEKLVTPEERRALAKHNAEVKRLIALREARGAAVRSAEGAALQAQIARDVPAKPAVAPTQAAVSPSIGKSPHNAAQPTE
jgi:hypothetical protein